MDDHWRLPEADHFTSSSRAGAAFCPAKRLAALQRLKPLIITIDTN
ncbi:hypothetical protein [Plasticicumulans acidivorans]|nr:hypothetical protein [Plasticicumulans acidivorans]